MIQAPSVVQAPPKQSAATKVSPAKTVKPANDERFKEILKQKKEKALNKDVVGFMLEKQQRT